MLPFFACLSQAATLRVGPNEPIAHIADAARNAKDGDIVEIMPGEYRGDVAIWAQKSLTIRGIGKRPILIANGKSAEDKAIWVIYNGDFSIDNIEFRGARVADRNGAGIRFERGQLKVSNCSFIDNQIGIMTANFNKAELSIKDSLFAQAPHNEHWLPHLLYVGRIARLEISGSRFHQGYRGHLIKSRAHHNIIHYNLIYDGPGGQASYEIDLPNGGTADIVGNVIGQSADSQNPIVIAYGAEGSTWPDNRLRLAHNTIISDRLGTWFLRVWSDQFPAPPEIVAINNLTIGLGLFSVGSGGTFEGNFPALKSMLGDPNTLDFTLAYGSILRNHAISPNKIDSNGDLTPTAEFSLPIGTRALEPPERWTPGAFQTPHYE